MTTSCSLTTLKNKAQKLGQRSEGPRWYRPKSRHLRQRLVRKIVWNWCLEFARPGDDEFAVNVRALVVSQFPVA